MNEWEYVVSRHAYRNTRTGKWLTWAQMVAIRDTFIEARQEVVRGLAARYVAGEIGANEFARLFRSITAETHAALAIMGAGGAERFGQLPVAVRNLQGILADQMPYAEAFLREIAAGLLSDADIANRAALYQGAAVEAYEQANADDFEIDLPYMPGDGDTVCLSNCRCAWNVETVFEDDDEVTYATWVTENDGNVCDDCAERGREYDHREVRRARMSATAQVSTNPVRSAA